MQQIKILISSKEMGLKCCSAVKEWMRTLDFEGNQEQS
jgi:hypothetical protein